MLKPLWFVGGLVALALMSSCAERYITDAAAESTSACGFIEQITERLHNEVGEVPVAAWIGTMDSGENVTHVLYANAATDTWTRVITAGGWACTQSSGSGVMVLGISGGMK